MKRVLTVGLTYTGEEIPDVEIENLGLCRPLVSKDSAAFPLYEYDTILINPASYTHFLFGKGGKFSDERYELGKLKSQNNEYDIDTAFDARDRSNELAAAMAEGATVVWCFSEPKRQNFFGWRDTYMGYAAPRIAALITRGELLIKKGRRIGKVDEESPLARYFEALAKTGWTLCLADPPDGYTSIASTPEGYSLGGRVQLAGTQGWLVTPPTSETAENKLIRAAIGIEKADQRHEKYHGIFMSHTAADKPFVRRLRDDLIGKGVPRVWVDEAEIEIGDSLLKKIEHGMKETRYIGVVLSSKSINAPWVKKELEIAMNREIAGGEVIVLPLLYEHIKLPTFLEGKLYADFTAPDNYEEALSKLLRRLRIKA